MGESGFGSRRLVLDPSKATLMKWIFAIVVSVLSLMSGVSQTWADINEWAYINPSDPSQGVYQSSVVCPGGTGVFAAPNANLGGGRNLTQAYFIGANLTNANLDSANLTNANLTNANLTNAILNNTTLTNANLTGANVTGTFFQDSNLTASQLYSTASYQAQNLQGISLYGDNLTGWNFSSQNLTNADLGGCYVDQRHLTGATVAGTNFWLV